MEGTLPKAPTATIGVEFATRVSLRARFCPPCKVSPKCSPSLAHLSLTASKSWFCAERALGFVSVSQLNKTQTSRVTRVTRVLQGTIPLAVGGTVKARSL